MISDLYDALTKYNVKMSVCGYWREHEGDDVSKSFCVNKEKLISPKEFFLSVFRGVNIGSYAWNKLYSKELFSAVRYPIGQKYEDINTTYKVVCQCEMIAIIPTCCYHYIYRGGSITSDISNIKDQIIAIEERDNYLLTVYPDMRKKIYQNLNDFYVRTWFQIIKKSNDYDEIYLKQLRRYLAVNIKYGFYRKKLWLIGLPIVFAPGVLKKIIRLKNN